MKYASGFVYQLPSGRWRGALAYKDGTVWRKKYQLFRQARNKTEAKRMLAEWRAQMELEADITPSDKDTIAYALDYIDYKLALKSIQPSSASDYKKSLRGWSPYLAGTSLQDLSREQIEDALRDMLLSRSSNTVLKRYVALNMVLDYAVSRKELASNPMSGIPRPKQTKSTPNSLDGETLEALKETLAALPLSDWVVGVYLCLYAGLRAEEACGLKFADIDLENRRGWVRQVVGYGEGGSYIAPPKNGQPRDFPISDPLGEILEAWISQQRAAYAEFGMEVRPENWLLSAPGSEAFGTRYIGRKWSMLCEIQGWKGQAGRKPSLHDLRHTFATQCVKEGMDIKTLQSILGHSSAAITLDVYASPDAGAKAAAAKLISRAI